ncbi:hypothetical protein GCM10008904_30520 [Paraclostridium ghonii]|uniref:Uncharacterized protein n=1 Tax=Paraclostridium ghonii TaxID=29358 RepID=A0ABU0MYG9_9FIRM|nr:hypothetical protein [Paeniclostridium ghonii]MDQ0555546.1 hypothetical protein [Paeniclostridium ghonii]
MKKSKKYDEYKNEAQNFESMVNHSQRNSEFQSQLEESQTVDKKASSKRQGALTKQISN